MHLDVTHSRSFRSARSTPKMKDCPVVVIRMVMSEVKTEGRKGEEDEEGRGREKRKGRGALK
jgi:hypothetical protein